MRTKLIVLALLVTFCMAQDFGDVAFIGSLGGSSGGGGGGEGGCATGDTTESHDELLEGWEGDGTENTWAYSGDVAGITITLPYDSSALTTGKVDGQCDQAMDVAVVAESGSNSYYTYDRGEGNEVATNVTSDFVFYICPRVSPDAAEAFRIVAANNSATPTLLLQWYVSFQAAAGPIIKIQATGASSTSTSSTNGTLTANTWYRIAIHSEDTAANSTMTINDWTPLAFTRGTNAVRYIRAGVVGAVAAGESGTYSLDLIAWNTP